MKFLFEPRDNTPLILFRILFGAIAFIEAFVAIFSGWVHEVFVLPTVHFPFIGFEWLIDIFQGKPMLGWYALMGISGLGMALGWRYRLSAGFFAVLWTGSYFMQKVHYNNHFYLVMLLSWLMILVPANVRLSFDARRNPDIKTSFCPAWIIWLFIAQLFILYTYAAVAKIYPDWLALKPISIWFGHKSEYWLIGPLLQKEWFQYFVAYGGILFDGLIVPALLWKRTRVWAFFAGVFFHLFNSIVFQIGAFPFIALSLFVFFFSKDTLSRVFFINRFEKGATETIEPFYKRSKMIMVFFFGWMAVQVLLPLRHLLWEGNVHWTEEGHRLSWHMMLRSKTGDVQFRVRNKVTGEELFVNPNDELDRGAAHKLSTRPDMCWQYVQHLKRQFKTKGWNSVEIYAIGQMSLNGRPYQQLYNSKVDLAKVSWQPFRHSEWLVPLKE